MGATTENARSPLHLYFDLGMNNSLWLEDEVIYWETVQSIGQKGTIGPYHLEICAL